MSALGRYLAAAKSKPWEWRVHDCCAFIAGWTGAELPDYADESEAEALIHSHGGLVALWERAASGIAEEIPTDDKKAGDVGIIEIPVWKDTGEVDDDDEPIFEIEMVETGAIWTGRRWAFVPLRGGIAALSDVNCVKAWRPIRCPQF